jgi:AraC-like DNA-binding protein
VHRLFTAHGATPAAYIRQRRLDRCRHDLANSAMRNVPVGAIGSRWGLPDASHFSRLFNAAYGMPPAEYRHTWGDLGDDETEATVTPRGTAV